ncbi:MAG: TetR/AcrR family transcriptional regulator [Bacteroidia bacterium]|nr:TetR/AcrR family transcriptional regulator [Bacteroidia bacterium]
MPQQTKQRILHAAIRLFNEKGLANVRLQQIADDSGISVGNLAYHFPNKDAIVGAVYERMDEAFSAILSEYLAVPGLQDLDRLLARLYYFFAGHRFYLIDLIEVRRSFPAIEPHWQAHFRKLEAQLRMRLDFYQQKGLLQPALDAEALDSLAQTLWMRAVLFLHRAAALHEPDHFPRFRRQVWQPLLPWLTPQGRDAYQRDILPVMDEDLGAGTP